MAYSAPQTWTTSQVVTAADLNQDIRDNTNALFPDGATGNAWSPTLKGTTSDPSVSATAGVEYTIGAIQFCMVRWVFSANGSGEFYVAAPATASGLTASTTDGAGQVVGTFLIRDNSPGWVRGGMVYLDTTSQFYFVFDDTLDNNGILTHNNPRTWASGDVLSLQAWYFVA